MSKKKNIAYFWESLQENKYARWHITLHKAGKGKITFGFDHYGKENNSVLLCTR